MIGLSVIIPVGPNDNAWMAMVESLKPFSGQVEIIVIGPAFNEHHKDGVNFFRSHKNRAGKQNEGAIRAQNSFLFFLHADSKLPANWLKIINLQLTKAPEALHHFDIAFVDDGPALMCINQFCAHVRSNIMKIPFGDQGFFMSKKTFFTLGCFNEETPYGEDHLLVWTAHQLGVEVHSCGEKLLTSARKYKTQGWLPTTLKYLFLTYKQALPEFLKLFKKDPPDTALAIFVKTPGFSPVKTRLASNIGKQKAEEFFQLSLLATEEVVYQAIQRSRGKMRVHWAVSEPDCLQHERWKNFNVISQGTGELGERLHNVFHELQKNHKKVIMIGADLPHLNVETLLLAHQLKSGHCIGLTDDGGFYLYAGTEVVDEKIWKSITYSSDSTANELIEKIGKEKFTFLQKDFDVDVEEDLKRMSKQEFKDRKLLPAQIKIIEWARNLYSKQV